MKVVAVLRSKRAPLRTTVRFDDGSTLMLPLETVMASGLRRGLEVDEGELQRLRDDAERWRCREAALRLIGFRARSGKELRGRLLQKGFSLSIVEPCLDDLFRSGLLDDRAFASSYASDRLRSRPIGRARLLYELRARGVDEPTARLAVDEAYANAEDELALARRAARRFTKGAGEDDARARRRLFGLLSRRGFSRDSIRAVVTELIG